MEKTRRKHSYNGGGIIPFLLLIMVVLQAITLYFLINPTAQPVYQALSPAQEKMQKENAKILEEVETIVDLPSGQPVVAEVQDIDVLKNEHPINAQVYADAQNGDKVIAYEDRLLIYRPAEQRVVYDGKNPTQLAEEQYMADLQDVLGKVSQLTELDTQTLPQFSTVGDAEKLREQDPNVFAQVVDGDKILVYSNRIIIYRPESNSLILDADIVEGKVMLNNEAVEE